VNVLDQLGCQVVKCSNHAGNRPYTAVQAWGVQALYFNANGTEDPIFAVDGALILRETAQLELTPCVYFVVPRESVGGAAFADRCSAKLTSLGGVEHAAAVLFDVEKVPLGFQAALLDRWDQVRPWRPTMFSVEPFQDATQNDYARMLRRNQTGRRVRKVTHQTYHGGMEPLRPNSTAEYLRVRGLADDDLCPTIDPAQPSRIIGQALACNERGAVLFESGRLPPA
jgi:hypothetical protein